MRFCNFCYYYVSIYNEPINELLAGADFVETDTIYNKNTELTYLFNGTVFDYKIMKWVIVACLRGNKKVL